MLRALTRVSKENKSFEVTKLLIEVNKNTEVKIRNEIQLKLASTYLDDDMCLKYLKS